MFLQYIIDELGQQMDYLVHHLLKESEVEKVTEEILKEEQLWDSGKKTAGSHASKVKNNFQLNRECETSLRNSHKIQKIITSDPLIKSYTLPQKIHGVMFTKTRVGQGYGMHIDNAFMSSGRSDLSFTLFLNDPNQYEGGELAIQTIKEVKKHKLNAGQIIIYPNSYLHSVENVTKGERLVCVGWIQSYITSNEDRNILFSLDAGARGLLAKGGRSAELDLIFQSYNNLLRRLGD